MITPSSTTVSSSAPRIDRRVGPDFNIVANHNRRELFDFHPSLCAGRIAKAIGTDCCVGVNHAPLADFHSVTDHGTGLDHRIGTNTCAVADVSARANPDPVSKQHICPLRVRPHQW